MLSVLGAPFGRPGARTVEDFSRELDGDPASRPALGAGPALGPVVRQSRALHVVGRFAQGNTAPRTALLLVYSCTTEVIRRC